jgi:hypothetical protein
MHWQYPIRFLHAVFREDANGDQRDRDGMTTGRAYVMRTIVRCRFFLREMQGVQKTEKGNGSKKRSKSTYKSYSEQ